MTLRPWTCTLSYQSLSDKRNSMAQPSLQHNKATQVQAESPLMLLEIRGQGHCILQSRCEKKG